MQIVEKRLDELQPYENNPRRNDDAVEHVAESIKRYGFKQPIVIDTDGVIVAGHTRYLASIELGLKTVPCVVADDLSDEEIREYRLVDNKVAEYSSWDWGALEDELAEMDFDFDFGFPTMDSQFEDIMNYVPEGDRDFMPDLFEVSFTFDKQYQDAMKAYISENTKAPLAELILDEITKEEDYA